MDQIVMLPQSMEAEQNVLGAMLNDSLYVAQVLETLRKEDFYKEAHQIIFSNIYELYNNDVAIDMVTLSDKLRSNSSLDKVGGITYISELYGAIIKGLNLKSYINLVKDKSTLRKLINAGNLIIDDSYNKQTDVKDVLENAERRIFNISQKRSSTDVEPLRDILTRGMIQIEELYKNKGNITGVPSGFMDLDAKTAGFQKGDMVLVAARPSMGKTTFALNIAEFAAIKTGKKVIFFSLEMSKEQLSFKLLCSQASIDLIKLRTGNIDDNDWESIARAAGPLSNAKMYIDDTAAISIMEVKSKCRRMKMETGLDLIVIDYLQLMSGSTMTDNRQQEVSEISRAIKALAKEMDCPVIACSQLSRAPEQRADHRPILSDLRESGSIEQDADIVMLLYRDEYYNKDTDRQNISECIIAKQRNGATGTVELSWDGKHSRFGNLDIVH
ncbi:MAG: replicative DNA helicase [Oscillospiraceae bacterium]|nr:replicative DNA helicase [Oscillospiraceae bacterium]